MELEVHPLAHCLPEMPPDQYEAFKEDISGLGVLEPITLLDGMILDGRHRYMACQELGIECPTRTVDDVSPHDLVRSMNLYRRHLNGSQRAMVAAALLESFEEEAGEAKIKAGKEYGRGREKKVPEKLPEPKPEAVDQAGEAIGVSGRSVRDAKVVHTEGTQEEIKDVIQGEKPVSTTAKGIRSRRSDTNAIRPQQPKKPKKKKVLFNETNENIGWASYSWNPVTGCKHGCPYCYADAMSKRYGWSFEPQLHADRLGPSETKIKDGRNNRVFTCSMGELFGPWVPDEWIQQVFNSIKQNPDWTFLFLTKSPRRLPELDWPANAWIGATIDTQKRVEPAEKAFVELAKTNPFNKRFISCEPLIEMVSLSDELLNCLNWLIVGAKSEGKNKIQPKIYWVEMLFNQARKNNIPVWFKDNLIFRPQENCEDR